MKDQRLLLKKCHNNGVPAIFFQGTDRCAVEILKSAEGIYKKNGCSMEFLYDFGCVRRNFEGYHDDYLSTFSLPKLEDARNVKVLIGCINEDIPVLVFQGTDRCAVEILRSAENIYIQNGCNSVYLSGFESFINEFEEYSKNNANAIKLPGLSVIEEEFVREDMDYDFESAVEKSDFSRLVELKEQGYQPPLEVVRSLSDSSSVSLSVAVQKIFGIEMATVPNAQLVLDMPNDNDISSHLSNAVGRSL